MTHRIGVRQKFLEEGGVSEAQINESKLSLFYGVLTVQTASLAASGWKSAYTGFGALMACWSGLTAAHGVSRNTLTVEDKVWMLENFTGQDVHKSAIETANHHAWEIAA